MDALRLPSASNAVRATRRSVVFKAHRGIATQHDLIQDDLVAPLKAASPALLTLQSSTLNSYNLSLPPTAAQLRYANTVFTSHTPHILFSAAQFRSFPQSLHPEVAFLGRSNVGKSSLLNALLNRTKDKVAHVSKTPGRTRTMNGFGVGAPLSLAKGGIPGDEVREERWRRLGLGGLVVVDMPGYGSGSKEEWGTEALKYLENRKQLKRTFVLVDSEHGLKQSDVQLLLHLRQCGLPHQVILSKVDKLLFSKAKPPGPQRLSNGLLRLREVCSTIRGRLDVEARGVPGTSIGDILCCSAEKALNNEGKRSKLGIDEVRWSILSACGMEHSMQGRSRTTTVHNDDVT